MYRIDRNTDIYSNDEYHNVIKYVDINCKIHVAFYSFSGLWIKGPIRLGLSIRTVLYRVSKIADICYDT